jgi:putative OPT family oligopeptide transporter
MVRELTIRAVVIGLVLSVVMAAANVYLGLKAGMTVSASIPAAVVGMLVLRGLFRDGTILEANQIQTAASAGESLAAGIIFTMPALVLIGAWQSFDFVTTTLIAFTGGLLGILFMIPMRRVFVVDNEELKYPEGVACAAVLETGDKKHEGAASDAKSVIIGALIGAALKFLVGYFKVILGTLEAAAVIGGRVLFIGADISAALVGVGFIVRLNVAVLVFIGGSIGWLICMPLLPEINGLLEAVGGAIGVSGLGAMPALPTDPVERAWEIWSSRIRYIGVGAMVVGGISSIITVRHGLVRAVVELKRRATASGDERDGPDTDRDLSPRVILALSILAVFSIAGIYYQFTGGIGITVLTTIVMIVMSFFFVAVASYIVGLVGNSNSPVSGMTITAVLFTGAMLFVFGFSGRDGMLATLGVAAIVCCAACTSGDVCNDLKTGSLVGAAPFRQQMMQIGGVAVASLVMAPILTLLHDTYGIGSRELSAPQAGLFASLAEGFFGGGELPWGMVAVGVVVGVAIDAIDKWLAHRKSSFRAHLMPVAVGMYLPFGLAIPILAGGVLAYLHSRGEKDETALDKRLHRGVLFSSGIIAGESLVGVVIALFVWLSLDIEMPEVSFASGLTLTTAIVVLGAFWFATKPKTRP